jgi:uncharacterized membrane protein
MTDQENMDQPNQKEMLPDPQDCAVPESGPEAGKEKKAADAVHVITDPDAADNRLMAGLSYISLLFIVPLLAAKRSEFAMHHCRQGIVIFAIEALLSFFSWIPPVGVAVFILTFLVSVYGFVQAWQGKRWELPWLGKYAKMLKV